jgi:hypothetical protein
MTSYSSYQSPCVLHINDLPVQLGTTQMTREKKRRRESERIYARRSMSARTSRLSRLTLRLQAARPSSANAARLILLALTWPCAAAPRRTPRTAAGPRRATSK